jgi:hypothetical protein
MPASGAGMKKPLPLILAILAAFALGLFLGLTRGCKGLGQDYWIERAKYDAAVASADAQHKTDLQFVQDQKAIIAEKDKRITAILAEAGKPSQAERAKDAQISDLSARVASLESQGDLAGALSAAKDEIRVWSEKFTLAEQRHKSDLFNLNVEWQGKFDAQVKISDAGWAAYDREHALRLVSDSLRIKAEHAANTNGIVAKVEGAIILGVGGYLGVKAGGHALKFW